MNQLPPKVLLLKPIENFATLLQLIPEHCQILKIHATSTLNSLFGVETLFLQLTELLNLSIQSDIYDHQNEFENSDLFKNLLNCQ
jgi:hypothetical protein